jgi:phosphoribosyl 1,2-cyclic phosphate phosphodiesterase
MPLWHGSRPILGFRFDRFAYLTDCNRIADESWARLEGLDVVVIDALREQAAPDALLAGGSDRGGDADRRAPHAVHAHVPSSAARGTNAKLPPG